MSLLRDALGSTLALTDAVGNINTTYTYEPFGNVTITGVANANPYQYTGRENDGTGFYYYRARYYAPSTQRFVSQDPLQFRGGINLYAYVSENPVSLSDPFGFYGTDSCVLYDQACFANGDRYDCYFAPPVCNHAPDFLDRKWARCVRQCLQEVRKTSLPHPNQCSPDNNPDPFPDHVYCFIACAENPQNPYDPNGPDLPDADPVLY